MSVDDKTATATLVRGFNKRVGRTKEIVLQSMGKVDRTEDGTFDFYVSNFSKQQANATKLQKYMGNYITTVRSMVHASIAFQDALKEVYEDEWAGKFDLINDLDHIKRCSHDYLRELDKSSTALYSYQAQFPDTRGKIDKRNRKLVDYDATRHTIEQLKNSKKRDDQKLKLEKLKAEEKNADAKRLYEHLNTELHDLLPALFDSRIVSYGSMLQSLFTAESSYHADLSKHNQGLSEVIDKLVEERGRGTYSSKRGSLNEPKAPEAEAGEDQDIYTVPTNNKAAPLPSGVLKRVLATHPYTAEDEDELSFTATDVFCVLPYEDPEEADDGWYFGFVEGKPDVKGVFPANFTRPLD